MEESESSIIEMSKRAERIVVSRETGTKFYLVRNKEGQDFYVEESRLESGIKNGKFERVE